MDPKGILNYPDLNLLMIFVFCEGEMKSQLAGPLNFRGMTMTSEEFEFILGKTGAIQSEIKEDPRPKVKDLMMSALKKDQDSDNDDW